jgi:DNA replication protein DnaC
MPLEMMLKELRLTAFRQHLDDCQHQAVKNTWSYTDFLKKLCEQELAHRFQIRTANWMREAKLPAGKSFATLNLKPAQECTTGCVTTQGQPPVGITC